jgi:glycosyltransferase involved in cell wall biosynthesis
VTTNPPRAPDESIRVVRVISRLNIGGPAIQAITLTKLLEPLGYHTTLVRGREDPREGRMDDLCRELGVRPVSVGSMRRNVGWRDALALPALIRVLRRERPHLVHTHAAKAGTLGRAAVLLAFRPRRRPALVHTFHGHSLTGYFSPGRSALFLRIERFLARFTDRLIAVSEQVRNELVAFGVAPAGRFDVVPLGFDLASFVVDPDERAGRRAAVRGELGIADRARVVTLVARLVPIKRVDRFLRIALRLRSHPDLEFVIVGDGELHRKLASSPEAKALDGRLHWAGFRRDMPDVYFASDVVVQTSDNEGTPVALIEAQAAGLAVVGTRVGGVESVVLDGETGRVTAREDETGFAACVSDLLEGPAQARAMGDRGQALALGKFSLDRLISDVQDIYHRLLTSRGHATPDGPARER